MAKPIGDGTAKPVSGRVPRRVAVRARRFALDARGVTSIEYALIAGLIFMVATASIRLYSSRMNTVYGQISGTISQIN